MKLQIATFGQKRGYSVFLLCIVDNLKNLQELNVSENFRKEFRRKPESKYSVKSCGSIAHEKFSQILSKSKPKV